jgi:CO/xanthine dehydrogenase Mo-binding subunit
MRLSGALGVAAYRGPYPHARLVSIDFAAARRAAGLVDVLAGPDVLGLGNAEVGPFAPNVKKPHQPLLAVDVGRYAGEPVAAVLADSERAARDAMDLTEAEWEPASPTGNTGAADSTRGWNERGPRRSPAFGGPRRGATN